MPGAGSSALRGVETLAVEALRIQSLVVMTRSPFSDMKAAWFVPGLSPVTITAGSAHFAYQRDKAWWAGLQRWVSRFSMANPDVEPGFSQDTAAGRGLASALALPLVNGNTIVGVLALYRNQIDAFAAEELVSLLELCPRLAAVILETEDEPADLVPFAEVVAGKMYS